MNNAPRNDRQAHDAVLARAEFHMQVAAAFAGPRIHPRPQRGLFQRIARVLARLLKGL